MVKSITSGEEDKVTINRVKIGSLTFYEITEEELERLETGGVSSIFLNFSIFTISIAISFFIALITSEVSDRVFTIFLVITIIGFLAGIILFILWKKTNKSTKKINRLCNPPKKRTIEE